MLNLFYTILAVRAHVFANCPSPQCGGFNVHMTDTCVNPGHQSPLVYTHGGPSFSECPSGFATCQQQDDGWGSTWICDDNTPPAPAPFSCQSPQCGAYSNGWSNTLTCVMQGTRRILELTHGGPSAANCRSGVAVCSTLYNGDATWICTWHLDTLGTAQVPVTLGTAQVPVTLGAAPRPIGTIYLKYGEQCGGARQPTGMKRVCKYPLICDDFIDGDMGTCNYRLGTAQVPVTLGASLGHGRPIGTIYLRQGQQCGGARDPTSMKRVCKYPLTCNIVGVNPGGFGTCEYPEQEVITTYTVGGPCGSGDSPSMHSYQCGSGLVCYHSGVQGSYGSCQTWYSPAPPSPSPPSPSPAPSGQGQQGDMCGNGPVGFYRCQSGLQCFGAVAPSTYGTCQIPGFHGRRLEETDLENAPEHLEAPSMLEVEEE